MASVLYYWNYGDWWWGRRKNKQSVFKWNCPVDPSSAHILLTYARHFSFPAILENPLFDSVHSYDDTVWGSGGPEGPSLIQIFLNMRSPNISIVFNVYRGRRGIWNSLWRKGGKQLKCGRHQGSWGKDGRRLGKGTTAALRVKGRLSLGKRAPVADGIGTAAAVGKGYCYRK